MSSPSRSSSPSRDRRKNKKDKKEKKEKEKKENKAKVKPGEAVGGRGRSRSCRRTAGQRAGDADEDEAPGAFGASGLLDEDDGPAMPPAQLVPPAGHRGGGSGGAAGSGRGLGGRSRSRDERRPPGRADSFDLGGFGKGDSGKGKGKGGKGKGGDGPGEEEAAPKEEPNFESSGLLAMEDNAKNGIPLKYTQPAEARLPSIKWRFYCFTKQQEAPKIMHIHRKPGYLFGKDRRVVDIPTDHQTCSKQHAVLHHRFVGGQVKPYIMDLESINGTFLNGDRLDSARYYEMREKDVLKFGMSSREFVLLHGGSANHIQIDPSQLRSDEE